MKWSPQYATGVTEIDEQHRALFDWLGQLEAAANDNRAMTASYSLTRLGQYARSHFAAEELLMAQCGYPRLEAHRAEHEGFRKRVRDLQGQALSRDISADAIELLRGWLIDHILASDMDYVPHVRKAG